MGEIVAIVFLSFIILALIAEKYLYAKEMNQKLSECIKAVMSRNIGEFIQATKKESPDVNKFVEEDEVALSEASDEEFNRFIPEQKK